MFGRITKIMHKTKKKTVSFKITEKLSNQFLAKGRSFIQFLEF